jgi:hypothetical protein
MALTIKSHGSAAFFAPPTFNPRNAEDLGGPAGFREKLLNLISRLSSTSLQPPTATQAEVAAELRAQYAMLSAEFSALK